MQFDRETISMFLGTMMPLFVLIATIVGLVVAYFVLDSKRNRRR